VGLMMSMENRCLPGTVIKMILLAIVTVACDGRQQLSLSELKTYPLDPANGLVQTVGNNGFNFEMIYRPKDLIIEQNVGIQRGPLWDSLAAQLKTYDYFVLRISRDRKEVETFFAGDPASYSGVVNYLNGAIANDITMYVGDETMPVSDALFAPSYGMSDASSIMLTFNSNLLDRKSDFTIVFEDSKFGTGRHEFSFEFASIDEIPQLAEGI
jgi:hypothetical protein